MSNGTDLLIILNYNVISSTAIPSGVLKMAKSMAFRMYEELISDSKGIITIFVAIQPTINL